MIGPSVSDLLPAHGAIEGVVNKYTTLCAAPRSERRGAPLLRPHGGLAGEIAMAASTTMAHGRADAAGCWARALDRLRLGLGLGLGPTQLFFCIGPTVGIATFVFG